MSICMVTKSTIVTRVTTDGHNEDIGKVSTLMFRNLKRLHRALDDVVIYY